MTLKDQYDGSSGPFEGDRTIIWRSLPSNAKVGKATVRVSAVAPAGGTLFLETISFAGFQGDFGTTKNLSSGFVEVDFHKRRTLAGVDGPGVRPSATPTAGANLQVDLGGLYVEINDKGAIRTPGDTLFSVPSDGSLPGLTVNKFKLTPATGVANLDVSSVLIRSVPTNLTVRIGTLAPVYSHSGELSTADVSADFGAILQAFLPRAKIENGFYAIPVVVHSDTVTRLRIEIYVEFVSQASVQPDGIKEVVVPFDFNTLPKTDPNVLSVALPRNAVVLPGQTSAKVVGAFDETRIVHGVPPGAVPPPYTVSISTSESQGQLILPEKEVAASAVDLLLSGVTLVAQLALDLRLDSGGKPEGASAIRKPVPFEVRSTVTGEPAWVNVPLPAEIHFEGGRAAYWLVLSSLEGEALWSAQPAAGSPGIQHTLDGGLSWHYSGAIGTSGPLEASFRLRNKPTVFEVPIQLNVGTGANAALVSLDRYKPLAKVEFTIDTPEFSQAFNSYLSTGVPPACPEGEHLLNGGFDQWAVAGDVIGTAFPLSVFSTAPAVVTSADGRWAYVAGAVTGNQSFVVHIVDVICDELVASAIPVLCSEFPANIAINSGGNRLYVVSPRTLCLVDAAAHAPIGAPLLSSAFAVATSFSSSAAVFQGGLAVSPDGGTVFLTYGVPAAVSVVATTAAALEQAARGLRAIQASDMRALRLTGGVDAMALSPDGSILYVAISSNNKITVVDVRSLTVTSTGIDFGDHPKAIDFTPDGKLALVLTSGKNTFLHLVDTLSGFDLDSIPMGSDSPIAVAASPDGTRAYTVFSPGGAQDAVSLVPVDLVHRRPEPPVPLAGVGGGIAITPQGDRIYLAGGVKMPLSVVPVGERSPAEWFVTSASPTIPARVLPACVHQPPVDLAAALGQSLRPFQPNSVAAGLSQIVPVAGSCSYELSFFGLATEPGALAEVFWLDQQGTLLQTDSLPIQAEVQPNAGFATLSLTNVQQDHQLLLHRAHVSSAAGAKQAEVRFTAPAFVGVKLALASLRGTAEALSNSDLQLMQGAAPIGWTLAAQYPRGVSVSLSEGGIRFINSSAGYAELVQTTTVGANQPYTWEFIGRPTSLASVQQEPSVELRWLKSDGTVNGKPSELPFPIGGFLRSPASGTTPDGTASVKILLRAPPGTGLEIDRVSLQTPTTVPVPLTFIAQAPGELRVSRSQVDYDIVPTPPPPVPSQGLATPTAPGSKPGDPPCNAYCPGCHDERPISQPKPEVTGAGRPITSGLCPVCGYALMRPGGSLAPGAPAAALRLLPAHGQRPTRALRRQPPPLPPLTVLPGIREGRARQLGEIGITTLEHLAETSPEEAARAMTGVSTKQAATLIEKAKEVVASHRRVEI